MFPGPGTRVSGRVVQRVPFTGIYNEPIYDVRGKGEVVRWFSGKTLVFSTLFNTGLTRLQGSFYKTLTPHQGWFHRLCLKDPPPRLLTRESGRGVPFYTPRKRVRHDSTQSVGLH